MRIFACTSLYVQGPGVIAQVGPLTQRIGCSPVIVIDATVQSQFQAALAEGFDEIPTFIPFSGEVTDATVAAITASAEGCGVVVAVGGGKALDAGKAVALRLGVPIISVPTIASNDGPASRGIAIYDEAHRLVRVDQMPTNPAAIIVDSLIIANAPLRFLRAGIGDAIAKTFEAEACWSSGGLTKHGTRPTHSGRAIARAAYQLLRDHAQAALADAQRHEVTEALEATIEACVLLSAMGFENGGLSIAHSVTRGLMTLRGAKDRLHGEHVAFGTLVQLAAEARSDVEILELGKFFISLGLPDSLAALGVDQANENEMAGIANVTMSSPHMQALSERITAQDLLDAIRRVEILAERNAALGIHI